MDRRQKKTRNAIFQALIDLLSEYSFHQITVGQIIERADVGRATFYAHFETKDFLLKELCHELFDHIFYGDMGENMGESQIFSCQPPESMFLHLFRHLAKNDNNILCLLSGENHDLFLRYFQNGLEQLIQKEWGKLVVRKAPELPEDFWVSHICGVFIQTVKWWIENNLKTTPEQITQYFLLAI